MFKCKTNYDAEQKIWYGPKIQSNSNIDNKSAGEFILSILEEVPDKVIQISANNGIQITGKQMHTLSIRACQNLQLNRLKQNDIIGIAASNSHYLAPIVFGSYLCGTTLSTLDPSFRKDEIKHIYSFTKPKIIFCDPENYEAMKDSNAELNLNASIYLMKGNVEGVETVDVFLKSTGKELNFVPPKLQDGGDQVATILCSSGTTGLPKGVCMSHRMLLRLTGFTTLTEDDVFMSYSSLYWLSGLITLNLGTMNKCLRVIIDEPFSTETFFDIVEKYRVTNLIGPPSQLGLITQSSELEKRDLSSITKFNSGGSTVPASLIKKFEEYLPNGSVYVSYGMSEIASCSNMEFIEYRRSGSVGQMMPNTEVKILDLHGKQLGVGEEGEICIRIDVKWPGYFGNDKATSDIYDENHWISTGDIGYFDNDGYLFVVDRKKDILKYKNFHVSPTEIEEIILELPDVIEVSVCGVPDIVYTDLPAALVVKKPESNLTSDDILKLVETKLADFKKLRGGVYFVKELPKTVSGKIQRNKVKEMLIHYSSNKGSGTSC
ncbi:uncharacterized protein LOC129618997 [Condylostylus longicornis]|uniref:uncharacterized protein LOC129618997 n=1 Tax=Condylostylus longicornis TaxID=2530218 RepID=UPI00244DFB25|nr:uncharacterized protein LOC129618997 [Condylostylus longicornis]